MRWLLDQGLPLSAAALLRENGMDADFHAMLAASGANRPSIIRIREEGLKGLAICQLIIALRDQFAESLEKGCVLTATLTQARLRLLPINS